MILSNLSSLDLNFFAPVLAAIVTAGLASSATFFTMKRSKSGQINTSEADDLWKESSAIRRELREQVQQLEKHISENEIEIAKLRTENAELKHQILLLRQENAGLVVQVERLKQENRELRGSE